MLFVAEADSQRGASSKTPRIIVRMSPRCRRSRTQELRRFEFSFQGGGWRFFGGSDVRRPARCHCATRDGGRARPGVPSASERAAAVGGTEPVHVPFPDTFRSRGESRGACGISLAAAARTAAAALSASRINLPFAPTGRLGARRRTDRARRRRGDAAAVTRRRRALPRWSATPWSSCASPAW